MVHSLENGPQTGIRRLIEKTQISVPFRLLRESYMERFVSQGFNPEIGIDANTLEHFSPSDFREIARRLAQNSLRCTLHGPFVDLSAGSTDPAVRALTRRRFEQLLELVVLFRPETVVCHAGYDWKRYGYFRDQWLENSIRMWAWLGRRIRDEGARLMLENVFEQGPEDIRILFENLEEQQVGFCLDTGHQSAFSSTALENWANELAPYLGQLHLHDNHGKKDDHLALGRGCIRFETLFATLKRIIKNPPVITLECHRAGDVRPSYEYLAKIWPW